MRPTLDTDLLRAFVAVAELGSITRATPFLGLTQSAVSLQIRRLEDQLGTQLFHRSSRGVQLTSAGEAFAVRARQILDMHARAVDSLWRARGDEAEIRLGINDVYAARHLAPVLDELRRRHPEARPIVVCDVSTALALAFDRGALNLCISLRHDPASEAEVVAREALVWVASRELALSPGRPVPLAVYPEYCVFRARALRALAAAERDWQIVFTSQGLAAINLAIDRGWGVAVKTASTVEARWRVLGEADGLPELGSVEVELRRSPTSDTAPVRDLGDLLAERLRHAARA